MKARLFVLLGLTAVAFAVFAPSAWGGSAHYLTIRGTSMEPGIHAGDVVIVREQDSYQVGDVIAYRSDMGGAVVLHRVVATLSDGYLLQGDNNTFVDRDQPSRSDVLGRKVFLVPHGERFVKVMAARWTLIVLCIGVAATWRHRSNQRGRHRRPVRRRLGSIT